MANFIDVVTFNDVIFDRNNEFNVFASEFTATRTGFYTFCAQVKLRGSQPGGGNGQLFLFKNRSSQGFIAELGSVTIQGNQCVQFQDAPPWSFFSKEKQCRLCFSILFRLRSSVDVLKESAPNIFLQRKKSLSAISRKALFFIPANGTGMCLRQYLQVNDAAPLQFPLSLDAPSPGVLRHFLIE
ncbi:hypothetical protein [Fictibacillus sp. KU28468]|uniref:hypothetical protein n=1 Tax=Fictibacillus sp. KU28468 TaxID=2991053 RepID=UPI00223E3A76|nr:hypothetical protein [Fictibacillus sp. KU28468]UZJ79296.1 hypothetical protein OKX00_02050 [Fictibacillus sp. KU28468]